MGIKDVAKKAVKYVTDKINEYDDTKKEDKELMDCKKLLVKAMSEHQIFRSNCAAWDEQYNGTHAVGKNIGGNNFVSNRYQTDQQANAQNTPKNARQNVNITAQLIEAQIDVTVPVPRVEEIEGDEGEERQKMIGGMLTYMSETGEMMRINSENERIVKKNSLCTMKVRYNPNHKEHKWIGRVETTNPHPTNVIPQPGQFRIKDMDYIFHIENRTVDQIVRMYGETYKEETGSDLRQDIEDGGSREYNYLEDFSSSTENTDRIQEKYSVVEKFYKDDDGEIGLYAWCGMVRLKKVEKFFYKRDDKGNIMEFEEVEMQTPVIDPATGQPQMGQDQKPVMKTETVKVKCHVPTTFPFVIQYNIPKEKTYYGKSDPEMIFDQQEGIKKMLSIEEEKLIKGTTKIVTRKGSKLKDQLTNSTMQVVETDNPTADMQVVQMHTNEQSYKDLYHIYTQAAKDILGVTDASLGIFSGGHMSARAIEALSQNSHARMNIKQFEKNIAYMELFRMWYDFILAYYDEKRPFRIDGPENKPMFGYFDKSKIIKQDDDGQWYYPPFDIFITTDSPLPKDKKTVIESANKAGNRMDNVEYWMIMESVGYPNAGDILERERQKEQQAQQNGPPKELPHESVAFKDMPVAGKIQMAKQMGIELKPEDFPQEPQQQPQPQDDPAHAQAMDMTKLELEQQSKQAQQQHDLQKIALQHQSNAESAQQKHEQALQTLALKAHVDAALNEQKAGHTAVLTQTKPESGGNK